MSSNVTNLMLNANTASQIASRVMKDRNIQIVDQFTPVVSQYKFHISPKDRITLTLTEDSFVKLTERFKYGKWHMVSEMRSSGTMQQMEDALMVAIDSINRLAAKMKKYRIIK